MPRRDQCNLKCKQTSSLRILSDSDKAAKLRSEATFAMLSRTCTWQPIQTHIQIYICIATVIYTQNYMAQKAAYLSALLYLLVRHTYIHTYTRYKIVFRVCRCTISWGGYNNNTHQPQQYSCVFHSYTCEVLPRLIFTTYIRVVL